MQEPVEQELKTSRTPRFLVPLFLLMGVLRLGFASELELVPDEAYYWLWSRHLDWSYYSKGPVVAWLIFLGRCLAGDTELGVRWPAVLLSLGTGWQLYRLGQELLGEKEALWALGLAAVVPLFAVGSVLMTIDPPSVFFWVVAARLFWSALRGEGWGRWLAAGSALGLGFLSKYVNVLELVSFALYAALDPRRRTLLRDPRWACLLAPLLLAILPVAYWNAQHGWAGVGHLMSRGSLNRPWQWSLAEIGSFVAEQSLALSPLIFPAMVTAAGWQLFRILKERSLSGGDVFLLCLFFPVFLFYSLLSFNQGAKGNWTATADVAGILLLGSFCCQLWEGRAFFARVFLLLMIGTAGLETVLLHSTLPVGLPPFRDPRMRLRGWKELAQDLARVAEKAKASLWIASDSSLASELSFYLPGRPRVYVPPSPVPRDQFFFWPGYEKGPGVRALFVTTETQSALPDTLGKDFSERERGELLWRTFRGSRIAPYRVWLLEVRGPAFGAIHQEEPARKR